MYRPLFFGGQRHSSSEVSCPATTANLGLKCTCSKSVFAIYRGALAKSDRRYSGQNVFIATAPIYRSKSARC
jgi:hypothetical protein